MLPKSVHEIAYAKVLGCMIGFVPYVVCSFFGLLLCAEPFFEGLEYALSEPWGWFGIGLVVLHGGLLLHLAAFMSLVVSRASLVIAVGIYAVSQMFLSFFTMPLAIVGGEATLAFNCMVLIVFIGLLHWGTLKLIELKAAQ
jgi:hypothetical protein